MTLKLKALQEQNDRPAYKQIADQIRTAIESQELAGGSSLPSEHQLMNTFGVARGTARQAIAVLKAEGLVVTERGRGAIVRDRPPLRRVAHERFSNRDKRTGQSAFLADVADLGRTPRVEIVQIDKIIPAEDIKNTLKLRKNESVLIRSRRYFADETPMQLATTYVPWRIAKGTAMTEENTGEGGVFSRLKEQGHAVVRYVEELSARPALLEESSALQLAGGVPVLIVHRVAYDKDDLPVELSEIVMASDRYVLSYETTLPK